MFEGTLSVSVCFCFQGILRSQRYRLGGIRQCGLATAKRSFKSKAIYRQTVLALSFYRTDDFGHTLIKLTFTDIHAQRLF
jgi:hypothetical protein